MKSVHILKLAMATLVLGAGMTVSGTAGLAGTQTAAHLSKQEKVAIRAARSAEGFIAKQKFELAVEKAELAVSMQPENAGYRALLGQAYLRAGRFQSAETAFHDSLALSSGNGRIALNLALAQIATGKNDAANATLESNRDALSPSDYGLAIALAGDPARGVDILQAATRSPSNDAKTRQNLALAYAMAGQWGNARVMAVQDLSPDMVDARMTQWASFVRPRAAWDQVAGLMKIRPAYDPGLPEQLALRMANAPSEAAALVAPAPEPVQQVVYVPAPAPEPEAAPQPVYETPVAEAAPAVPVFKPHPVAAPKKVAAQAPLIRSDKTPLKQAVVRVAKPAAKTAAKPVAVETFSSLESGKFVVQLGAFSNEGGAQIAWNGALKKTNEIGNYSPAASRVQVKGASLYRLAVSGFVTREAAGQVCAKIKAAGGGCFVRSVAGDAPLQWASRGGNKIAARR
jgi:Flp pilus assembly protein TadD/cell division septation protein DedD